MRKYIFNGIMFQYLTVLGFLEWVAHKGLFGLHMKGVLTWLWELLWVQL
jgi:hypothetical protein